MEELVKLETLLDMQAELNSRGSNHVERLAKALCILLGGLVDVAIEEYDCGSEAESDEG